MKVFLIILDLY